MPTIAEAKISIDRAWPLLPCVSPTDDVASLAVAPVPGPTTTKSSLFSWKASGLGAKIGRHGTGRVDADLPGNIDGTARTGDLHHMGVAARRGDPLGIEEAQMADARRGRLCTGAARRP